MGVPPGTPSRRVCLIGNMQIFGCFVRNLSGSFGASVLSVRNVEHRDMNEVLRQSRNGSSRRRVSTAVMTGKDHTISIDLFLVMVLYRV